MLRRAPAAAQAVTLSVRSTSLRSGAEGVALAASRSKIARSWRRVAGGLQDRASVAEGVTLGRPSLQVVVLPADVGREADVAAAPVEAQRERAELAALVVDCRSRRRGAPRSGGCRCSGPARSGARCPPPHSLRHRFARRRPARVSGSLGARLGSRLIEPPTPLPPGAVPFRKVLAPRKTSTRSKNSEAMYWRGSMPYRPL